MTATMVPVVLPAGLLDFSSDPEIQADIDAQPKIVPACPSWYAGIQGHWYETEQPTTGHLMRYHETRGHWALSQAETIDDAGRVTVSELYIIDAECNRIPGDLTAAIARARTVGAELLELADRIEAIASQS